MNLFLSAPSEAASDVSLVKQSLAGNRDSFGLLVARYQSPLCALAYSACGDVAKSEDLAQEALITAWRKLSTLKEPERFGPWLFGIARNLAANAFRRNQRNPIAGAKELEEAEPDASGSGPDEQVISREEEWILWQVLSGMPALYREPMVLFYRENESVSRVAEVLEISEDAVRQRLSRGRALLSDRVASVVRNGLRRTRPTEAFAGIVVAAVAGLAGPTTAEGAVVGMISTKSASPSASWSAGLVKGIGFFGGLVAIPAAIGAFAGYLLGRDASDTPRRRESVARFWRLFIGGLLVFLFLPLLLTLGATEMLPDSVRGRFLKIMTVWLGLAYPFAIGALICWRWQRRRQVFGSAVGARSDLDSFRFGVQGAPRPRARRVVAFIAIAATGLLVFCFNDMRHEVARLQPEELESMIQRSAPGELSASISVRHYRSLWGASPETYRTILVAREGGGRSTAYLSPATDAIIALLAQKGVACPVYVEGRDFEVLGAPGRWLPMLAAFILLISVVFLLQGRAERVFPAAASHPE